MRLGYIQHLMKNFIVLTSVGILFFQLTGCTQNNYDPNESITITFTAHPKSIDPRISTDATGQRLNSLIFSALVRTDSVVDIKGEAAYKWDYKNKVYTFY